MKQTEYYVSAVILLVCAILNTIFMVLTLIESDGPTISIGTFMWSLPIIAMYIYSLILFISGYRVNKHSNNLYRGY